MDDIQWSSETLKQKNCPLTATLLERLLYLPISLTSDSFSLSVCLRLSLPRPLLQKPDLSLFFFFYRARKLGGWHSREEEEEEERIGALQPGYLWIWRFASSHGWFCAEWSTYMKLEHWKDYLNSTLIRGAAGRRVIVLCEQWFCGKGIVYMRCFLFPDTFEVQTVLLFSTRTIYSYLVAPSNEEKTPTAMKYWTSSFKDFFSSC